MAPNDLSKLREVLKSDLVGRMLRLQDVSDDGYEIVGRILEAKIEGNTLSFVTSETQRKWRGEDTYVPNDINVFSASVAEVREFTIASDGTISFSPWEWYDNVYILPSTT